MSQLSENMTELSSLTIDRALDLKNYPGIALAEKIVFSGILSEIEASAHRAERTFDLDSAKYFHHQTLLYVSGAMSQGGGLAPSLGSDIDGIAAGLNPETDKEVLDFVSQDFKSRTGLNMDFSYVPMVETKEVFIPEGGMVKYHFKSKPHNLGILDQVLRGNVRGFGATTLYFDGMAHEITKEDVRRVALYDALSEGPEKSSSSFSRSQDPLEIKYGYGGGKTLMAASAIGRIIAADRSNRKFSPLLMSNRMFVQEMVENNTLSLREAQSLLKAQSDLILVKSSIWSNSREPGNLLIYRWFREFGYSLDPVGRLNVDSVVGKAKASVIKVYEKLKREFLKKEGLLEIYQKIEKGELSFSEAEELGKLKPDVFVLMAWEARDNKTLKFSFEASKNDWLVGLAVAKSKFTTLELLDEVLKVNDLIWKDDYIKRIIKKNKDRLEK